MDPGALPRATAADADELPRPTAAEAPPRAVFGASGATGSADRLPRPVRAPKPHYPDRARDLGEQGAVIVAVLVDDRGRVEECRVARSSGYPLLDGSAVATVRERWRFEPARHRGRAVRHWVRIPIEFRIGSR